MVGKKGIKFTEEHKKRISESMKGKKHTEETKRKLSENHPAKKSKNWNSWKRGISWSQDAKNKRSIDMTGKKRGKMSERGRSNISSSRIGITFGPQSQTHKMNISKSLKGKYTGEKSPNWKGGLSFEPYCPKFNKEFKERVRQFFGYKCSNCGLTQVENIKKSGKVLSVHHVSYNKEICCDGNKPLFVALCGSCHAKTNNNREYWEKIFAEMITKVYDGKCYINV